MNGSLVHEIARVPCEFTRGRRPRMPERPLVMVNRLYVSPHIIRVRLDGGHSESTGSEREGTSEIAEETVPRWLLSLGSGTGRILGCVSKEECYSYCQRSER